MKEIQELILAFEKAQLAHKKCALATVVYVDGSSYRRPGARMLVTEEGEFTGAISGGCLEGDALHKAMLALSQAKAKLVTYDTGDPGDISIGLQLGCEGIIRVLFEPVDTANPVNPVALLKKTVVLRQRSVLVTLFSATNHRNEQAGTCLLLEENGTISGKLPYPALQAAIINDAHEVMHDKKSHFKDYTTGNSTVTAFLEFLQPPVSLVIIGAGNDAVPMMKIADILGWEIRIVDGRPTHAKTQRFLSACQVLVSRPEKVLDQIPVDEQTVFVMMTHNYNYDLAMLKALLHRNIRYLGILGPKKKLEKMLDEMRNEGIELTAEDLGCIFGPAGLETGAETAEEIALSILAEIQTVLLGKSGGSLRDKNEVIHPEARRKPAGKK